MEWYLLYNTHSLVEHFQLILLLPSDFLGYDKLLPDLLEIAISDKFHQFSVTSFVALVFLLWVDSEVDNSYWFSFTLVNNDMLFFWLSRSILVYLFQSYSDTLSKAIVSLKLKIKPMLLEFRSPKVKLIIWNFLVHIEWITLWWRSVQSRVYETHSVLFLWPPILLSCVCCSFYPLFLYNSHRLEPSLSPCSFIHFMLTRSLSVHHVV